MDASSSCWTNKRCAACARCNAARLTARGESEGWDAEDDITRPPLGRKWHHAPSRGCSWRGFPWTDPPEVVPAPAGVGWRGSLSNAVALEIRVARRAA